MDHPSTPQATAPVTITRPLFYRRPALVLALIALLLIAVQWYDTRLQVSALREELAHRLATADALGKESQLVAEQVRESTREAQVKIGVLESKLQESQNQQIALEALYQELSRSRDESTLADIEQTLLVASQQLQITGNVKSALIALTAADARLARVDRPQLSGLRKVLARDIARLKLAPYVDVAGLSARLDNLMSGVDTLPLAMEVRPTRKPYAQNDIQPAGNWERFKSAVSRELFGLIRVEKMDQPETPLLEPAQIYFLRENVRLRLLSARLELLARDQASFKSDLDAARTWLTRYFDVRDKTVTMTVAAIQQLGDSKINIDLPDIAASLEAVRNYRLTRERSG